MFQTLQLLLTPLLQSENSQGAHINQWAGMAVLQLNCVYGHGNLNCMQLFCVTKHSSSSEFFQVFKNVKPILSHINTSQIQTSVGSKFAYGPSTAIPSLNDFLPEFLSIVSCHFLLLGFGRDLCWFQFVAIKVRVTRFSLMFFSKVENNLSPPLHAAQLKVRAPRLPLAPVGARHSLCPGVALEHLAESPFLLFQPILFLPHQSQAHSSELISSFLNKSRWGD